LNELEIVHQFLHVSVADLNCDAHGGGVVISEPFVAIKFRRNPASRMSSCEKKHRVVKSQMNCPALVGTTSAFDVS